LSYISLNIIIIYYYDPFYLVSDNQIWIRTNGIFLSQQNEVDMCLLLIAYDTHPRYHLVLAANRDEFYERPTAPLGFWEDNPQILAGRDLRSGGTWLGIARYGRLAAITNYRDPKTIKKNVPSRGLLVKEFLSQREDAEIYIEYIKKVGERYNGFSILLGDKNGIWSYSNRGNAIQRLDPGIHGVSNHLLNTPWPKVEKGKSALGAIVARQEEIDPEEVLNVLSDKSYPPDGDLPDTGIGLEKERMHSPLFVASEDYGTRSSSVILMERGGKTIFLERRFSPEGCGRFREETSCFKFMVDDFGRI